MEIADDVKEAWNNAVRMSIPNTYAEVRNLAHLWAYAMSYSACDTRHYYSLLRYYSNLGAKSVQPTSDLLEASEQYKEERKALEVARMERELPAIMEWVERKGYLKDNSKEAVRNEAIRIWRKHNMD